MIMKDKRITIQFRADEKLKEDFYNLAGKRGQSPSELLRNLILKAMHEDNDRILKIEEYIEHFHFYFKEMILFIRSLTFLTKNEKIQDKYDECNLDTLLKEVLFEYWNKDGKFNQQQYEHE